MLFLSRQMDCSVHLGVIYDWPQRQPGLYPVGRTALQCHRFCCNISRFGAKGTLLLMINIALKQALLVVYLGGQDLSFASNAENLRMLDNKSGDSVFVVGLSDCLGIPVKIILAVSEILLAKSYVRNTSLAGTVMILCFL